MLARGHVAPADKFPGLGDVPVLGSLFRSRDYLSGETELVIVVTPYLVNPVNDSEIVLPTDGFQAPNAIEQFLLNREAGTPPDPVRPMPQVAMPPVPATAPQAGGQPAPAAGTSTESED